MARRPSSWASASAGKRCPPVPPAASITERALTIFAVPIGVSQQRPRQEYWLFDARRISALAREREQHADGEGDRQQGGAAGRDDRQRHALGRHKPRLERPA